MGFATPEKKERNAEIYQLHLQGQSYFTLAKKYDITPQAIAHIIQRYRKKIEC